MRLARKQQMPYFVGGGGRQDGVLRLTVSVRLFDAECNHVGGAAGRRAVGEIVPARLTCPTRSTRPLAVVQNWVAELQEAPAGTK